MYGIIAITLGLLFLAVLITTIISRGTGAFAQTFISVPVELREDKLDKKGNRNLEDIKKVSTFGYNPLLGDALSAVILEGGFTTEITKSKELRKLLSSSAVGQMRAYVIENTDQIGQTVTFDFFASSRVDGYIKGRVTREDLARDKNLSAEHLDLVDQMIEAGVVRKVQPKFHFRRRRIRKPARTGGAWRVDARLALYDVGCAVFGTSHWRCSIDLP